MNGVLIHPNDNVIIALKDGKAMDRLHGITLLEDIDAGHKVARRMIQAQEEIIKYGEVIGHATCTIKEGEKVHTHNMKTSLVSQQSYQYDPLPASKQQSTLTTRELFGYRRNNGAVGIRNELWVIVTVGCVNAIAQQIVSHFKASQPIDAIDGIFTFAHPYGCSQMGEDQDHTIQILRNMVMHPNAGGVLVLGLGCENNQLKPFYDSLQDIDQTRIRYLNCQDAADEIQEGIALLHQIYSVIKHDKREPIQWSDITFGLKCGGSDGFSGITANPLVGAFSDQAIALGANCILSEVPEMFGAEHILMNRAKDAETFARIVAMINQYKDYFTAHNQVVYENPSPGNKAGGITTLEEKSLGCIQKAGSGRIQDVLSYGQLRKKPGISLLYGPGNDMVSVTAMAASGAQLVLFTTGRGTPFGGFVPTIKISSHSTLYEKKQQWIDFNAGMLLEGVSMEKAVEQFMDTVITIINGTWSHNEENACRDIALFKQGVTL